MMLLFLLSDMFTLPCTLISPSSFTPGLGPNASALELILFRLLVVVGSEVRTAADCVRSIAASPVSGVKGFRLF